MRLEDYFEFVAPDEIRIKGTRIGIETIVEDYLEDASPEEIAARYRTLSLEQVYAAITYYMHTRVEMDAYLDAWRRDSELAYLEYTRHPSPPTRRLRQIKERRADYGQEAGA